MSDGAATPQRLVIVLPTTGEFDSRTYRIASTVAGRGHSVTVIARAGPGLPNQESDPSGYRVVRVTIDPYDALPFPGLWRRLRRRTRTAPGASSAPGASVRPAPPARRGVRARVRAAGNSAIRILAIVLTVRAQIRASRAVDPGADLYHGMAYMGIPVALSLARRSGGRVVYDARDIYVEAGNLARLPAPLRAIVARLERGWARRADRVVTVNEPYAGVMAAAWGPPQPLVVMNCAYRFDPPVPPERRFHALLGLPPEARIVLYQGGYSADRGIAQLILAIRDVPDAVLVLMGYGVLEADLERAAADPASDGRIRLVPPVSPVELIGWVAAADVVAMPIQSTTLNHRLTTPNKLFEALAAGVPLVASDLPGMAPIVIETGAGLVVDPGDSAAIAAAIRAILDPATHATMAALALAAAHQRYNWASQGEILLGEYGRITGRPW